MKLICLLLLALGVVLGQDGHDPPDDVCKDPGIGDGGVRDRQVICPPPPCEETEPEVREIGCKRYLFYKDCRDTWPDAQKQCQAQGGRLWEPANQAEYDAVFASIGYSYPPITPTWLVSVHWWIGFKSDVGPAKIARHDSTGLPCNWRNLDENSDAPGCVDIYHTSGTFGQLKWGDHPCDLQLKYICEIPTCCCYGNQLFPLGSVIKMLPHCCTYIRCDEDGSISEETLTDSSGNLAHDCCIYTNRDGTEGLVLPNSYTWDGKYFCCEDRLIRIKYNKYVYRPRITVA